MEMFELVSFSFATALVYAAAAILMLFWLLRRLDKINGRPWSETIEIIRESPLATAVYYGFRWIGACMLIGWIMSR